MTSYRFLPLALLLAVSAYVRVASAACPQFFPGGQPPALVNPKLQSRTTLFCNGAYAVLASGVTHGALWSAKYPTAASLEAARGKERINDLHADDRLPFADQAQVEDYRRSGYDRGHMTPSGDESAVRRLTEQEGKLFLVTDPAFVGQELKSIDPDGVLVPSGAERPPGHRAF